MAESYVTKFTKYVAEQRKNLATQLKNKGLNPSPTSSLGALVSELENLQTPFKIVEYERDSLLPDFDEMFDNDPLRAVNGGQYKACSYHLYSLMPNSNEITTVSFGPATSITTYTGEKVVFSDGVEYANVTASLNHTVDETGVYTDSNGFRYVLCKIYATEPKVVGNGMNLSTWAKEIIDDYFIGTYFYYLSTSTTYNVYALEYVRFVNSNVNGENYGSAWNFINTSTSNQYQYASTSRLKHLRIDNSSRFSNIPLGGFTDIEVLDFRGDILTKDTETAWTLTIGYSSTSGIRSWFLNYVKIPSCSTLPLTVNIWTPTKYLYIPDNVDSCNIMYAGGGIHQLPSNSLQKLHIGNGLTKGISSTQSYRWYPNLTDVTVANNAFYKNESAITVDFAYAPNLTKESVLNMFNNFADRTGMTANILKLHSFTKALMTDEEKAILTNKNWTLS